MYTNSDGSGETARMRKLAWAFAGRLCDKYQNLVSWLIYQSTFLWSFFALIKYLFLDSEQKDDSFLEIEN